MTNEEKILVLAQRIYRTMNKTTNQNITGEDLTIFLDDTIGWVNDYLAELESEVHPNGEKVYWNFLRTQDDVLGTATTAHTYTLDPTIDTIVASPYRNLTLRHDGTVVSSFDVVNANQIGNPSDHSLKDRVTVIDGKLLFSRELRDHEVGADIVADSIMKIPELSREDVSMLTIVKPLQLVVLGTAKNWILPDKVSGGLSPSFAQRYDMLLERCKRASLISGEANWSSRESFSDVGGVGF